MTTAIIQDSTKQDIKDSKVSASPLDLGAGHVDPNRAINPGLVYDLSPLNYLNFLCSLGYNATSMASFPYQISAANQFSCPQTPQSIEDFNYPSLTWHNLTGPIKLTRALKNVGHPGTYTAQVVGPTGVSIDVNPQVLKFDRVGQELTFEVTATPVNNTVLQSNVFGHLTWSDGTHVVRSPLSVIMQEQELPPSADKLNMKI